MLALVIDDSKTTRMILRRMLKELGFEVEEAENGREALDLLESGFAPNIVLVDWNMPVMDGYQFVKAVRSKPKFNKLVLMMLTTAKPAFPAAKKPLIGPVPWRSAELTPVGAVCLSRPHLRKKCFFL